MAETFTPSNFKESQLGSLVDGALKVFDWQTSASQNPDDYVVTKPNALECAYEEGCKNLPLFLGFHYSSIGRLDPVNASSFVSKSAELAYDAWLNKEVPQIYQNFCGTGGYNSPIAQEMLIKSRTQYMLQSQDKQAEMFKFLVNAQLEHSKAGVAWLEMPKNYYTAISAASTANNTSSGGGGILGGIFDVVTSFF